MAAEVSGNEKNVKKKTAFVGKKKQRWVMTDFVATRTDPTRAAPQFNVTVLHCGSIAYTTVARKG
jgi:hypothetical protein